MCNVSQIKNKLLCKIAMAETGKLLPSLLAFTGGTLINVSL